MSLETVAIGEVTRVPREKLTPGTLIEGFTDYNQVVQLIPVLAHKLHAGGGRLAVRFYARGVEESVLIDNLTFRNTERFWGKIKPEQAMIIQAAMSLVPPRMRPNLNPDGLAFVLRYGLWSSGKAQSKAHWVTCALFHELEKTQVTVFGKEGGREILQK